MGVFARWHADNGVHNEGAGAELQPHVLDRDFRSFGPEGLQLEKKRVTVLLVIPDGIVVEARNEQVASELIQRGRR